MEKLNKLLVIVACILLILAFIIVIIMITMRSGEENILKSIARVLSSKLIAVYR